MKIEHTKTHKVALMQYASFKELKEGTNNVLVTDAELVLVKCTVKDKPLLFRNSQGNSLGIKEPVSMWNPILISRIEKREVGDLIYDSYRREIRKANTEQDTVVDYCFKILALPEHFSPSQLQDIVDGKLKEGKCLVECEQLREYKINFLIGEITMVMAKSPHNNESNSDMSIYKHFIKLNPHITIYLIEEKMYTRDQVIDILNDFVFKEMLSQRYKKSFLENWLNENVK